MNTETAKPNGSTIKLGSAFEAPIPSQASDSLRALISGHEWIHVEDDARDDALAVQRLGVASGLFRALKLKHPPSARHSLRVAVGCSVFASTLGLDEVTRERLEVAALMHDVGKLGVPDVILNKSVPLSEEEFEVMDQHVMFGLHILESCCTDHEVLEMIRESATWFDGSRPNGSALSGEDIPLGARILSIQDAFDAMTTDTVYRQALSRDRAIAELFEHAPSQFDPKLVAAFYEAHNDCTSEFESVIVRRWVDLATEDADNMWSLRGAVTMENSTTQTIFQKRLLESMHDGVIFVDTSGRIMVWNQGAQALTGLSKESVHHKSWQPEIIDIRDMDGNPIRQENCPLLSCFRSSEESICRFTVTNRINKERLAVNLHTMPVLDSKGVNYGAILIIHDISSEHTLEERVENLHHKATKDALTGVGNRAEFDRRHKELVDAHTASGAPLGLVICDIDKFKSINDTFGHQAGDEALVEFAQLIDRLSRDSDIVARYGGEEFVLLCPGCSSDVATQKAEEIRRTLAAIPQPALANKKMTASFGVTTLQPDDTPETMLKRADEGLYEAKESGRNLVVFVGDEAPAPSPTQNAGSWMPWKSADATESTLAQAKLRCSVPAEVVLQKVRGFVGDNSAIITSQSSRVVTFELDESLNDGQQRSDRPFVFKTTVTCRSGMSLMKTNTQVEVRITGVYGRDRRRDEISRRADELMLQLKEYLVVEDL